MEKLALGLLRRQPLKKVRQLYPVTHDRIGFPIPEMFSDIKTIIRMIEALNGLGGT